MNPNLNSLSTLLLLTGLASLAIAPPLQAQTLSLTSQCYNAALSFGARERDRDRAAYLCDGAISTAPAQCYWQALGFGASTSAQDRAAHLCRGATNSEPAQCYWNSLGLSSSPRDRHQATNDCSAIPTLTLPLEIQHCVQTTRYQLHVSSSSALQACSAAYYYP